MEIAIISIVVIGLAAYFFRDKIFKKKEQPKPDPVVMKFKAGDIITTGKVEEGIRKILEVHNGYYIWCYIDVPYSEFDSRNSTDPELTNWKIREKPEPIPEPKPDPQPKPPKNSFDIDFSPNIEDDQTDYILEQINAALSEKGGGRKIIRFKSGDVVTNGDMAKFKYGYGQNGVFKIEGKHNFEIRGDGDITFRTTQSAAPPGGSVSKHTYSHRRHFWIFDCYNFLIDGINIEGAGEVDPAPNLQGLFPRYYDFRAFEHAIALQNCNDVEINKLFTNKTFGDGLYFGGTCNNIKVTKTHIKQAGRQGTASGGNLNNVLFDELFIDYCARSATDWETDHQTSVIQNIEVKNSKLFGRFTAMAALGRGTVKDIYYHDNEYIGTTLRFMGNPDLPRRENIRWENNTRAIGSYGSPVAPAIIRYTDNITYKNNIDPISTNQSNICLELGSCGGIIGIQGNDFNNDKAYTLIWGDSDVSQLTHEDNTPNLITIREQ